MSHPRLLHFAFLGCSALAACAQAQPPTSAVPTAAPDSMVIVRDPQTGQLRAPTPAELRALQPAPGPAPAQGQAVQGATVRPDGTRVYNLGEHTTVYSVVRRQDGKLVEQCVEGEQAATQALDGVQHKDGGHGHDVK